MLINKKKLNLLIFINNIKKMNIMWKIKYIEHVLEGKITVFESQDNVHNQLKRLGFPESSFNSCREMKLNEITMDEIKRLKQLL